MVRADRFPLKNKETASHLALDLQKRILCVRIVLEGLCYVHAPAVDSF